MSAKIQLYMDYISQPSRTVLAFCLLNAIPVDIREVRIAKLQHLSDEFQKTNPMKKVPAIFDPQNGLSLGQSHAIVNYLLRKYKLEEKWGLDDERQRAKIDEYLHYHHQNTRKCAGILYTQVFSRLYPVDQSQALKKSSPRKDVENVLDFIEEHYFIDSDFMLGKKLTVADLAAYFQIQSLVVVDYDYSKWSKITHWMAKLSKLKQIQETNQNFMRLLPKIKLPPAKL